MCNSREHTLPRDRKVCKDWETVTPNSQWEELWSRHTGNDSALQIRISLERDKVDVGLSAPPVWGRGWVDQIVGDSPLPWEGGTSETR